jgi:hypothetical protein
MRGSASRSSPGAFPFILLGIVDGIDAEGRNLTLADRQMRVADYVSLDGVRTGLRLVVVGMREGAASERAIVVGLVPVGPLAPCATSPPASEGRTLVPLLVTLLIELAPDVESLDCRLLPADRRYAVSVTIPGTPATEVLLPRRLLERADEDPAVRGTARSLLSAAARFLRAKHPIGSRRRAPAGAMKPAPVAWSRTGRRCDRCETALATDDPVIVEGHLPRHLACPPAR